MERVATLIKKLQDLLEQNAPPAKLLLTAQMLQEELNTQLQPEQEVSTGNISILVQHHMPALAETWKEPAHEERTVELLHVDEAEMEAELEQIKKHAEEVQKISSQNKPPIVFEEEPDIPTLTHQTILLEKKEVNDSISPQTSLNERLKQSSIDLGDILVEVPIRDLRKAIGINDRFLYIKELFRNDESVYERSIKTINNFSILPEAEYWIQRELKVKLGWDDSNETVKQFNQLVKRRFS